MFQEKSVWLAKRKISESIWVSLSDLIEAIKALKPEDKELFIESILAATSPEYLESIKQARQEYQDGKTFTFDAVFKKK